MRAAGAGLVLALGLTSCAGSIPRSGALIVYNGQHAQTTQALVAAFENATGIRVSVRSDSENILADQIVQEGTSSPADVVLTENSPALEFLQAAHLLAPVDRATLGAVGRADSSPTGHWVGVSARVSVLVYNTSALRPGELPRSILDLARPRWAGKLAIAPQETDFQPIVTAVARAYGKKVALRWLDGIQANGASHEYQDNEAVTAAVNSGQAEIAVVDHYYWYRLRAELHGSAMRSAIAFFAPHDPGYVVDVSGAAVLKSTRHMKDAQRFLAFLVSTKGQAIIAHSSSYEYPLAAGVEPAPGLPALSTLAPYAVTPGELGDGATAVSLMRLAQLIP